MTTSKRCVVRRHLDVITLEEVQVRLALTGFFTHQRQDGVIVTRVHDGLTVLNCTERKVLQLVLRQTTINQKNLHTFTLKKSHDLTGVCLIWLRYTLVSESMRLTDFSSTCRIMSWVHTFPLASNKRSFLIPSSMVNMASLRSITKVVRC